MVYCRGVVSKSWVAGPFSAATAQQPQAVTGGTGAFRGARGEVTVRAEADQILVRLLD